MGFRAFLFSLAFLALGCMAPDPSGPGSDGDPDRIQEENLLAGATSSTNWPQEDAGRKRALAVVTFDSAFRIHFTDTSGNEIRLEGKMAVYGSGDIPLFHAPDSTVLKFPSLQEIEVPASALLGMGGSQGDSIAFTVRLEMDSLQCLITGFSYSRTRGVFSRTPKSELVRFTYPISIPEYSLHAVPGDSLPQSLLPNSGKKAWCLYIPASPYYFVLDSADFIDLGPLPQGTYPFRLLLIGEPEGEQKLRKLTVFEVKSGFSRKVPGWNTSLELGQKIDELSAKSSISIRL